MKKYIVSSLFLFIYTISYTQNLDSIAKNILKQGIQLFKLEQAAFEAKNYVEKRLSTQNTKSFLAYQKQDSIYVIFWGENSKYINYTMTYNGFNFAVKPKRKITKREKKLLRLRKKILQKIAKSKDLFQDYNHIEYYLNILDSNGFKVYLTSITDTTSLIPLGNDFLLTYSKNCHLKNTQKLHQNIILIEGEDSIEKNQTAFHIHSSKSSPYITPTDIVTILMYNQVGNWEGHLVFSNKYVSYFNQINLTLKIFTKDKFKELQKE